MSNAFFKVPTAKNEPVRNYEPGSAERESLLNTYRELYNGHIDVTSVIGGEYIKTDDTKPLCPPHDHKHQIGTAHYVGKAEVEKAVKAALDAKPAWENMPWQDRAAIFLRAADLLSGPWRNRLNASTMLAQSKNVHQAEIEAACEFADFLRFNVEYMTQIYTEQPQSPDGMWNRMEHRALEGFVFAISPFNFTAIAGNLPMAPALMGNTVVWKAADSQLYSAHFVMELFRAAGLPDGVINLVIVDGPVAGDVIFNHYDFAGLHFTGSTGVFRSLWQTIGNNIAKYRTYPRIVGETGGKDFVAVHKSANAQQVAANLVRGAFEYQGQKCSAASRAYVPENLWPEVKEHLVRMVGEITVGTPEDTNNFMNAVIDERAFDKIASYIDFLNGSDAEVITGGTYDKSQGYFVQPTIAVTQDPKSRTMVEEIFGPVLTIYVYPTDEWEATLDLVDGTSEYALTGAIFSNDRYATVYAIDKLRHAAGNFYINDKPTGAVVGQQPFGGSRGSGTNDKAGSVLNLLRWTSPRTMKETYNPVSNYKYPFLG
jgi:1-pyrroline-5-carboxylate dehydrogenase